MWSDIQLREFEDPVYRHTPATKQKAATAMKPLALKKIKICPNPFSSPSLTFVTPGKEVNIPELQTVW
jgi:hypothetical protein